MNISSLSEKRKERQALRGSPAYNAECHRVIASLKNALRRDKLASLSAVTEHFHKNPHNAPAVVTQLNASINRLSLICRWLPGDCGVAGALLIRNESVGLLIETKPGAAPQGIMLTPGEKAPFCALTPEYALSILSLQARR